MLSLDRCAKGGILLYLQHEIYERMQVIHRNNLHSSVMLIGRILVLLSEVKKVPHSILLIKLQVHWVSVKVNCLTINLIPQ